MSISKDDRNGMARDLAAIKSKPNSGIVAREMEEGRLQGIVIDHLKIVIDHIGDIYEDLPQSATLIDCFQLCTHFIEA